MGAGQLRSGLPFLLRVLCVPAGQPLIDLRQPSELADGLFALKQLAACDRLMKVVDDVNERWQGGR